MSANLLLHGNGKSPTTLMKIAGSRRISSESPEIKLALVGCLGVGKSALVVKYFTKRFIMEYDPSLEDVYSKTELIDGREYTVKVMDTSDSDDKSPDRYLKWSHGFIVVFSITNHPSFAQASRYLEIITKQQELGKEAPVYLVGNKVDLERYRMVTLNETHDLATRFDVPYLETSAADDLDSVIALFHETIRDVIRARDRQIQMQSLYISEERSPLLGGGGGFAVGGVPVGGSPSGQARFHQGNKRHVHAVSQAAGVSDKKEDAKTATWKTTTSFKIFNKGFKLFN